VPPRGVEIQGLGDDFEISVVVENLPQAAQNDGVIVGDHHSDAHRIAAWFRAPPPTISTMNGVDPVWLISARLWPQYHSATRSGPKHSYGQLRSA